LPLFERATSSSYSKLNVLSPLLPGAAKERVGALKRPSGACAVQVPSASGAESGNTDETAGPPAEFFTIRKQSAGASANEKTKMDFMAVEISKD